MKLFISNGILLVFILPLLSVASSCNIEERNVSVLNEPSDLIISEFMCSNQNTLSDIEGDFPDWIELENMSQDTLFLNGFGLSDTKDSVKFKFKDGFIPPLGHLVVFASGKKELENHVEFKLKKSSGMILLYDDNDHIVQLVEYPKQVVGYSFTLFENLWFYSKNCSPGRLNSSSDLKRGLASPVQIRFQTSSGRMMASLSTSQEGDIKYTTNGESVFSNKAQIYSHPFQVDTGTVVNAAVFEKDLVTNEANSSVFIDYSLHNLPVLSLTTDPRNLWNDSTGIYVKGLFENYKDHSENSVRSGYFKFHAKDGFNYEESIDFKLYGTGTRVLPKKSLTIKPKDGDMDNFLFTSNPQEELDGFVLRAAYSDASRFKNEVVKDVNDLMGSNLLMQEYQPCAFYLNGKYWGVFNIYERKNDEFIKAHRGKKVEHLLTGRSNGTVVEKGSNQSYREFIERLNAIDIKSDEAFKLIENNFELSSLIDFWVQELYTAKVDRFNNRFWKTEDEGSKWSFIDYDFDIVFKDGDHPRIKREFQERDAKGIQIFGKCIHNPTFAGLYFTRLADFMNFGYTQGNVQVIIDKADALTREEFERDYDRWVKEWPKPLTRGENQKRDILNFITLRSAYLRDSIAPLFGYKKKLVIRNSDTEKLQVFINGFSLQEDAIYFEGMEVDVEIESRVSDTKYRWLLNGKEVELTSKLKIKEAGILQLVAD